MLMVQTAMTFATLLGIVLYQCEVGLATNSINSSVMLQQHSHNQMSQLNYEFRAKNFRSCDDLILTYRSLICWLNNRSSTTFCWIFPSIFRAFSLIFYNLTSDNSYWKCGNFCVCRIAFAELTSFEQLVRIIMVRVSSNDQHTISFDWFIFYTANSQFQICFALIGCRQKQSAWCMLTGVLCFSLTTARMSCTRSYWTTVKRIRTVLQSLSGKKSGSWLIDQSVFPQ